MDVICYLNIVPKEIREYIIFLTENKVFDLCLVNKYFNNNCKIIKIVSNFDHLKYYPKLTNVNLKELTNLTSLNLYRNDIIKDEGIIDLINLNSIDLFYNKKITNNGLK